MDLPSLLLNPDAQECETHFQQTHSRTPEGRYVVRLTFKIKNVKDLQFPGSYAVAKNTLLKIEKRFLSDPFFGKQYTDFMLDYDETGHMSKTTVFLMFLFSYFIPHHGILIKNSLLPKLRTVLMLLLGILVKFP